LLKHTIREDEGISVVTIVNKSTNVKNNEMLSPIFSPLSGGRRKQKEFKNESRKTGSNIVIT
jgi:hypothetical protein